MPILKWSRSALLSEGVAEGEMRRERHLKRFKLALEDVKVDSIWADVDPGPRKERWVVKAVRRSEAPCEVLLEPGGADAVHRWHHGLDCAREPPEEGHLLADEAGKFEERGNLVERRASKSVMSATDTLSYSLSCMMVATVTVEEDQLARPP